MQNFADREDHELIALVVQGDRRAYEGIVVRYQRLVFNVIYQLVKNMDTAADLTQETFLKAYQALPSFRTGAPMKPWLLRIASNNALNYLRSLKSVQSLEQILEDAPALEPASHDNVEKGIEFKLTEERLAQVLATLQPQHRHLFLLRYQHDLSYEEISIILEQPVTTIKSLLFRVRTKVRQLMAEDAIEIPGRSRGPV